MIRYYCKKCNFDTDSSECPFCHERTVMESKMYWCENCNVPIYDDVCPLCGFKGEYFATDARPVFPEERLLIEILLEKPFCFINSSVWNTTGNRYFVDGKKIDFLINGLIDKDANLIREQILQLSTQNTYDFFNQNIRTLIQANSNRYNQTTIEAMEYIKKMVNGYDNSEMFVSFSGGKDSTVVSDLVIKAVGRPDIIHIFGDTTLEFDETTEYIERFKAANRKTPVLRARNTEQDFFNLCETVGPPSRMLRWCCTVFKTGSISQKIQRTFKDKKRILTFYGIRRNESNSRSRYERNSDSPKISKQKVSSPIIDWMDYDIWLYILTTGIDFNRAYKYGYTRVGCWCCPNNSRWSQFLASIYMPEKYERFNKMLLNFAVKMGKTDPEDYVKQGGWKARQGGAGIELSKNVAINFKPCATDERSFDYELNKPITEDLYELFKPFGILSFEMGNKRLGEVYVLDKKDGAPILKLQGRIGTNRLRISILRLPIANRTKLIEVELKFKCQITKYQLCVGCHACESVCKYNAIVLRKQSDNDCDYKYLIDDKKCNRCFECINHYDGGCYMRKCLLPRGEGSKL